MEHQYLYGYINGERLVIKNTPEQITAFIMKHKYTDTIITTPMDELVMSIVKGGYILKSLDQEYLRKQLFPILIPVQMGTKRAPIFTPILESEENTL